MIDTLKLKAYMLHVYTPLLFFCIDKLWMAYTTGDISQCDNYTLHTITVWDTATPMSIRVLLVIVCGVSQQPVSVYILELRFLKAKILVECPPVLQSWPSKATELPQSSVLGELMRHHTQSTACGFNCYLHSPSIVTQSHCTTDPEHG